TNLRIVTGALVTGIAITGQRATGVHYQVDGAIVRPLPIQEGGIPIWVAGGGEQVTLKIAAKYARYTNFGAGDIDAWVRKSELLREHCEAAGTSFDAITRSANFNVSIAATEQAAQDVFDDWVRRLERVVGAESTARYVGQFGTGNLIGTPEQIVAFLREREAVGLDYTIAYFPNVANDRAGQELFEREVIPALA
ncbi:MAG: LLM class flavin-dependent oxidoreductase, partial [Microbacteriaceae bacterium]|nr:LLM class flavin-dependent oxidoreductase [Microbacteriaceae bacterium]